VPHEPDHTRPPAPPHRTGRAVCPHPALRAPSPRSRRRSLVRRPRQPIEPQPPVEHRIGEGLVAPRALPVLAPQVREAPTWPCGRAPAGEPAPTLEVPASRQSPWLLPVGRVVHVRPLPSGEVLLSLPCERYYGPLRLPGQPGATSGAPLLRRGGTPGVHWTGSPVVPCAPVRACHPCYPGGSGRAGQLWGLVRHRPSPNVHRVGTLSLVTRLRLGSLHATACAVARPSGALVRELGALGYPAHLPQATWATLPIPRAGLPPASLTVSTACGRCQVKQVN